MSEWIHIDFLDSQRLLYIGVDIAIALVLILMLRFLSGWVSHVKSIQEIAIKDNFAFGISLAGGILALIVMLTGVVTENTAQTLGLQIRIFAGYGLLGVGLIKIGRSIQDLLVLRGVSIQEEIIKGNMAAAIVDVANALVTAMVVRSVMLWVNIQGLEGLLSVLMIFLGAQIVIGIMTLWWMKVYHRRHPAAFFTDALKNNHIALAARYAFHTVGASFALAAAAGIVNFYAENYLDRFISLIAWIICGIIMCALISIISRIGRRVILAGVDVADEIDIQNNLAVAAVEGTLYLSIGFYVFSIFG